MYEIIFDLIGVGIWAFGAYLIYDIYRQLRRFSADCEDILMRSKWTVREMESGQIHMAKNREHYEGLMRNFSSRLDTIADDLDAVKNDLDDEFKESLGQFKTLVTKLKEVKLSTEKGRGRPKKVK